MEFIINTKPISKNVDKIKFFQVKNKIKGNETLTKEEIELFLDFYVSEVRHALETGLNIDIENDPLENKCDLAQKLMGISLERAGVVVYPHETQETISTNVRCGHSFLTAIFNGNEPYLIDLTYRQFFKKEECTVEKIKVIKDLIVMTPDPGFFVSQSEELTKTATSILEKGYVKLTNETAKHYGDSFYFTKTGREQYSNIPGSVYMNAFTSVSNRYSMTDQIFESKGFSI